MIRRCALCGRRGLRQFEQAPAALLERYGRRMAVSGTTPVVLIDVCRSVPACRRRRGLPA